jgi:acyl carrier protein
MEQFFDGLAEILEIEATGINPELDLNQFAWDSLAIISVIALVDDCFNVTIDVGDLGDCQTVSDILKLVEKGE